jgi:4-carboxymuconolactone decarboxylase
MSRLAPLASTDLNAAQRAIFDAICAGPRGERLRRLGPVGPFGVWVRSASIGNAAQAFGAAVRFDTQLPERTKEVAICVVGAHYRAKFEFAAHAQLAKAAGVPAAVVEAIRCGNAPEFDVPDDRLSYRIAQQLLQQHRLDDALYAAATTAFGEAGLIELVTIIGYYGLVSLTLNAFDVPLTADMHDPFPEEVSPK